jgi:hypothetical protein
LFQLGQNWARDRSFWTLRDIIAFVSLFVSRVIEKGAKRVQTGPSQQIFGNRKSLFSSYFRLSPRDFPNLSPVRLPFRHTGKRFIISTLEAISNGQYSALYPLDFT